jgi:heme exporter protein C
MKARHPVLLKTHLFLGFLLIIATLALIGYWVPPADNVIGESYLIFFIHFPSAFSCLVLFLVAGAISARYLWDPSPRWDLAAAAGVEVGLLATTVTLITGSIWARAAWGIWWDTADPRLMSVAVMWLTYAGYTALRSTFEEPGRRARFSAVFGVIAALNVFIVYFSIQMLGKSHHPMNIDLGEPSMVWTRWIGAASFLVLYSGIWRLRSSVLGSSLRARRLEEGLVQAGV